MKITKEQLNRLVKIATLNILRELQSRASEGGIVEEGKRLRESDDNATGWKMKNRAQHDKRQQDEERERQKREKRDKKKTDEGKRQRNREKDYNKSLDKQTAMADRGDYEGSEREHYSRENKAAKDRARFAKSKRGMKQAEQDRESAYRAQP